MTKIFTLGRSREQWGSGTEGHHRGGGLRRRGRSLVRRQDQGEESGVGRPGAGGRASGIWGRGVEGGGVGAEVGASVEGGGSGAEVGGGVEGGGVEVGQPDGTKPNFTAIRVSRRRGYSPYTRYNFCIG
jgi:hypothetical protein